MNGLIIVIGAGGGASWGKHGLSHDALLVLSGALTAGPLLCFAAAARRVPLTTIGLLQFMTPVMQLLVGVLMLGESMSLARWVGFALVWLALVILTADSLSHAARARRTRRTLRRQLAQASPTKEVPVQTSSTRASPPTSASGPGDQLKFWPSPR